MSILASNGNLWDDFIAIFQISHYLECAIHKWNRNNDQIIIKVGHEFDGSILNILYGDNPFEHANRFNYVNLNFQK